jgi:acetoin utilization deacetylase AcuC-like enzyme
MGRGGLYLPVGGLVEEDVFVDNTARIVRTRNLLASSGVDGRVHMVTPRPATLDELLRVHSEEHLRRVREGDSGDPYTPADARSYELAVLSAGSALTAVELVLGGGVDVAHAMLRRSGHHASRDAALGFCLFNNCAIAAAAARSVHGLERVAVVDVDAHHGNGTEALFYSDPYVLTVSIHQDRSFPVDTGGVESIGADDGLGFNVNVNLPAGVGDPGYHDALDRLVLPILGEFAPELLIVACGVDANLFDPLARLGLTAAGFAGIAARLLAVAEEVCGGQLVSVQEGGYSHVYAPFCWLAFIETIARLQLHDDPFEQFVAGQATCRELAPWQVDANDATRRALAPYWKTL